MEVRCLFSYPKIHREWKIIFLNVLKHNKIIKERCSADTAWNSCVRNTLSDCTYSDHLAEHVLQIIWKSEC